MADPGRTAEQLLAHADWLRGLARRLAGDADVADDLVQETWIASLHRSPDTERPLRPWLAKVLRNALKMRARGEGRRVAREQVALIDNDDIPTPDTLVARAEAQRTLVDLVLRLDDPYRTVVLLHYSEGIPLAQIAREQGVPAGTVRWRLKVALDQLRRWLDEPDGRGRWAVAVLAIPKGLTVAHRISKVTAIAIALVALLLGVGGWYAWHRHGDHDPGRGTGEAVAGGSASRSSLGASNTSGTSGDRDGAMPAWLAQQDIAPRRIAGRVTYRGAPVAGATVELASLASESGAVRPPRIVTDARGAFDFGPWPAMTFSVRASAPHRASATLEVDLRVPGARPAPDHLELSLGACNSAIYGTVRDASGGPIAGARVAELPRGPQTVPGGPGVVSDDRGAYELCVAPMWPYWVAAGVSADGYGSLTVNILAPGRVHANLLLVPEAVIVGRVVRAGTGEPVVNASVYVPVAGPRDRPSSWRGAFSDADGRFRIDRVAPGRHVVFARATGLTPSRGVAVVVEAGHTTPDLVLALEAGSTIHGMVVDDGRPIEAARVTITGDTNEVAVVRSAVSQSDGSFVLDEVPQGTIRFAAPPYDVVSPKTFLVSQPVHEGVVLEVQARGAIAGIVVRDGAPVAGAAISPHGPGDHQLAPVATGRDGRFVIPGVQPGAWTLGAEADGAFGGPEGPVTVRRGETSEVTIDLAYAASISGRVVDQHGAPVGGVSVQFLNTTRDDAGVAVTADDGSFRAGSMTGGGDYRPIVRPLLRSRTVFRPASGTAFAPITLAGPHSQLTNVVLAVQFERLAIAGTVVDATGAPVPDAQVIAVPDGDRAASFFGRVEDNGATSTVDGSFAIDRLPAGSYAVRARTPAGTEATVPGVPAGRSDLRIVLAPPSAIEGTLVGFDAPPKVYALLGATSANAPIAAMVTTSSFAIRGLSPGHYLVTATTAATAASAAVDVAAGNTAHVTLTSRGTGAVTGHVHDLRSGAPVEGMNCFAIAQPPGATVSSLVWASVNSAAVARTDGQGAFAIAAAPAGDVAVWCNGLNWQYSTGLRPVVVPAGKSIDVEVPVMSWDLSHGRPMSSLGAGFADAIDAARLIGVKPGGPASTAGLTDGDVVTTVDGLDVTSLSSDGVDVAIINRSPGTRVPITVVRAGKSITATVVLGELDAP